MCLLRTKNPSPITEWNRGSAVRWSGSPESGDLGDPFLVGDLGDISFWGVDQRNKTADWGDCVFFFLNLDL